MTYVTAQYESLQNSTYFDRDYRFTTHGYLLEMGRSSADAEVRPKNSAECSARQHVTIRPKFGQTSANIRRHFWLRICGVLRSPLALTKVSILTISYYFTSS